MPGPAVDRVNGDGSDPIADLRRTLAALLEPVPGAAPIAFGWATVDLDRLQASMETTWPGSVASTADLGHDVLLGARCRHLRPGIEGLPALVLIEPSTEGRLAATLARHGEGPAAIWVTLPSSGPPEGAGRSVAAPGPFGSEVLLLDGPVHGPHRLVVLAEPGTITA